MLTAVRKGTWTVTGDFEGRSRNEPLEIAGHYRYPMSYSGQHLGHYAATMQSLSMCCLQRPVSHQHPKTSEIIWREGTQDLTTRVQDLAEPRRGRFASAKIGPKPHR